MDKGSTRESEEDVVKPKLVACLFFSMLVGGACAVAVVTAGGGPLAGLAAYSLAGSITLVPSAFWAAYEPRPRTASGRSKMKRPVVA